jgi:aldose 1-epimerase
MSAQRTTTPQRTVELRSADGRLQATFLPHVGMLGWSLCDSRENILGHPVGLEDYVATGEPTGIALLHPWANRLASPEYEIAGRRVRLDLHSPHVHTDPHGLPIHGLAAASPHWEVLDEQPSLLRARLVWDAWPELAVGFPFAHVLHLAVRIAEWRLEIVTALVANGDDPVPIAFGFHPYLRLPGIERERWHLTLPVTSRMVLDERMLPTGESVPVRIPPGPLADRTFDDTFDGLADPADFQLAGGGRRLRLRLLEGYRFAQVYAPPGSDFISFEPMTAPIDPFRSDRTLLLAPGERYRARFDIGIEDGSA